MGSKLIFRNVVVDASNQKYRQLTFKVPLLRQDFVRRMATHMLVCLKFGGVLQACVKRVGQSMTQVPMPLINFCICKFAKSTDNSSKMFFES